MEGLILGRPLDGLLFLDRLFSALAEARQPGKVLDPLPEIILVVLCVTLAGAEDFVKARLWGRGKLAFLRHSLLFRRGIPSHDTLNDVINALDPALFCACFTAWVEGLREDVLAQLAQPSTAAAQAVGGGGLDHALAWQMLGEGLARWALAGERR